MLGMTRAERLVGRAARWADRLDRRPALSAGLTGGWAVAKTLAGTASAPILAGIVAWQAIANHRRAKAEMVPFARRITGELSTEAVELDATAPVVITSDLHRCIAGPRDLVGTQDCRELYLAMLHWYADRQYRMVENGDVEDFWMVGGSVWGATYDLLRLTGAALGDAGRNLRPATYRAHLDRIVAANAEVYDTVTRRFVLSGRYVRTVGNHDDVYTDPRVARYLSDLLGGATIASWVRLVGPEGVEAVITHGHQVDGWNAPGHDWIGKLASWLADTVGDLPVAGRPGPLDGPDRTQELIGGQRPNQLLAVHERFGVNSSYDSLDEELLFEALRAQDRPHPWLLLGHTHAPVLEPWSRSGSWWERYANSGYGIGNGLVTALEWPGGAPPRRPLLVAWCWGDRPEWADQLTGVDVTVYHRNRPVHRVELEPSADHRHLVASAATLRASG
jgi:hypothetical protein